MKTKNWLNLNDDDSQVTYRIAAESIDAYYDDCAGGARVLVAGQWMSVNSSVIKYLDGYFSNLSDES